MIKSHIEAIQREIKERFGVEAKIEFFVFGKENRNLSLDEARDIVAGLQPEFDAEIQVDQHNRTKWIRIENCSERRQLSVFYCGGN